MKSVQPIRDKEIIENMKRELAKNGSRDEFLFVFGINVGLRIQDILKLKVKDVKDKTHITVIEQKTENTRKSGLQPKEKKIRINSKLQEDIENYTKGMSDEDYLFQSKRGNKPIQRVQAWKILNKAANSLGLEEIGTHTMRKTYGYHFYQRTKDVALLQDMFGHSSPSITLRYIGINQDVKDQAMDDHYL